jgi:ankyrin repeat protein
LEVLRDCLPSSVRRTLNELPESLDETYERILKEIKKPNRDLARRVLQCLVVAARPLRVAELAEVLAVDVDNAEGIPRLNSDWRWEDQEQALLIACSSLIAIVEAGDVKASDSNSDAEVNDGGPEVEAGHNHLEDLEAETNHDDSHIEASNSDSKVDASDSDSDVSVGHSGSEAETDDDDSHVEAGDSRIVQFSHFSVKEFLTSSRLATAGGEVSNFHIDLKPAHMILADACLGVLLQTQDDVEGHTPEDHPLARYAAEHWTTHAQFGEVSSRLQRGMEYLFDPDRPHFEVWITLYDMDTRPTNDAIFFWFTPNDKFPAAPLYYAALCGFHDLVKHLITKNPQDVNADGGYYVRPIVAALAGEHFQTADLLRHNSADLHVRGRYESAPLHSAAFSGNFEVVRKLIDYDPADIDVRDGVGETPLLWAAGGVNFKDGSVHRLLLEHGADINVQTLIGWTPLHWASFKGALEVVRLLLEHGADVEAKDKDGKTALEEAASRFGHDKVVELLREYGAK